MMKGVFKILCTRKSENGEWLMENSKSIKQIGPKQGLPHKMEATNEIVYYKTYFQIEAGYNGGNMSREKCNAYYDEIQNLFTAAGWTFTRKRDLESVCPTVALEKSSLYCHPQSLSGPVAENLLEHGIVESIIQNAKTFSLVRTDRYEELKDWDDAAYFDHLKRIRPQIEETILALCQTKRKNLCVDGAQICWNVAQAIRVKRIEDYLGFSSSNPAHLFVQQVFDQLVKDGRIEELERRKGGIGYRTKRIK